MANYRHCRRYRCRRDINAAIKELQEARYYLGRRKYERAEDELADALKDIARALRCINRRERYR